MKKILLLITAAAGITLGGCKKFIDVNDNPNNPTDVQEALILAPVELAVSHTVHAGYASILSLHYTQAVALNQPVPNSGTYLQVNSEVDGEWSNVYSTCLNNLKNLRSKAEASGNANYGAIAKILTAWTLGFATDLWGDIPYSEAFQGTDKLNPAYDSQESIYAAMQALLDDALADIGKGSAVVPRGDDLFYGGDMEKWEKLAYTLKARYYMHLTKAPGINASTQADLALAALAKGMQSNDDDLKMAYPGSAGNENPWYLTFLPGSTLVLSSYTVETLKNRNDPRLPLMVAEAQSPSPASNIYNGRAIGTNDIGSLQAYSIPASFYAGADAFNYVVNYSEALFLQAEATFIKSGATAAQPVYQQAVVSHMDKLGVPAVQQATYLLTRGVLTPANALQLMMEEKATANFLSSENFSDWRRTGFPALAPPPNALFNQVPRRLLYPQIERIANPQALQSAAITDRVWWDK